MIKVLSLFSGIGAFEKALTNLNIDFELIAYCDFDKYASKSYSAIHGVSEDMNLGDITKIDETKLPKDIDLITYGFPCQDISLAGKQKGFVDDDGNITRSGLFFEALRIIEETQPKIAIAENVKNLTGKKFAKEFEIVLTSLEKAGYNNYWQVLNAKDYGVPQNRERVFIVSIRKDIDHNKFEFPKPFELTKRLKDLLEDEVDEKFYLSDKMVKYIAATNEKWTGNNDKCLINKDIASTLNTGKGSRRCDASNYMCDDLPPNADLRTAFEKVEPVRIGGIFDTEKSKHQAGSIWDKNNISPTLDSMQGGYRQPLVMEKEPKVEVINPLKDKTQYGWHFEQNVYDENGITRAVKAGGGSGNIPKVITVGNYSPSGHNASRIVDTNGLAPTVMENHGTVTAIEEPCIKVREATKKGYAEAYEGDSINLEQPNSKTRRGRVGHGVAQTLTTSPQQAVVEPTINKIDIPQIAKVRKYPVDTEGLVELLRGMKRNTGVSNKQIAEELDVPLTKVEHWFRRDDCFAIPDAELWFGLKDLLKIETTEFDKAIMTFKKAEKITEGVAHE